jgi:hypothetical protein
MSEPYSPAGPYFMGTQFVWWQGVVEDINDPLKLGRCRVRILGFHNPDTRAIPVDHLPWATVVQPVTSAAISEVGQSPTGLLQGSWVIGFFRDPQFFQEPIILGSIAGIPLIQGVGIGDGFADPDKKYPLETHFAESDLSRLARNENIEKTAIGRKLTTGVKGVTAAFGITAWNEPLTPYNAIYPKNHVFQTESGHIQEFDDTPTRERIHTYHRSGTFSEVHPDGTTVNKIVSNKYEIVLKNDRLLIRGRKYENIDKDSMMTVGGNLNIQVEGYVNISVNGNTTIETNGDSLMQTNGDHFHKVKGTYTVVSERNMTMIAPRIDFNPKGVEADQVEDIKIQLDKLEPLDIDQTPEYGSDAANLLMIANSLNPSNPYDPGNLAKAASVLKVANVLNGANSLNIPNFSELAGSVKIPDVDSLLGSVKLPSADINALLGAASSFSVQNLNTSSILNGVQSLNLPDLMKSVNSLSLPSVNLTNVLSASNSLKLPDLNPNGILKAANSLKLPDTTKILNDIKPSVLDSVKKLSNEGSSLVKGFDGVVM